MNISKLNIVACAALSVALLASCDKMGGKGGFTKSKSGLEYKVMGDHKGKTPGDSDYVEFHIKEMTEKDSVLTDTRKADGPNKGAPAFVPISFPQFPAYIKEALKMLSVGDSGVFQYPSDSLFKGEAEKQRPPFLPKGSHIRFALSLVRIADKATFEAANKTRRMSAIQERVKEREKYVADLMAKSGDQVKKDDEAIEKYIKDHKITGAKKTSTGLYYVIDQEGTGPNIMPGDNAKVNYTGMLLSDKIFDSSVEAMAKKAGKYDPKRPYGDGFVVPVGEGRVIPGWDEGLTYFNKGSKGRLLIPSYIAYGAQGTGADIPANSPLVFEIEIMDIMQ